jgi:hypothetical protein
MSSTNNNDGLSNLITTILKSLSNKQPEPSSSLLSKISIPILPSFLKGKPVDPVDAALSNIIDIIYEIAYNKTASSFSLKNNMLSLFNRGSQNGVGSTSNIFSGLKMPSFSSSSQKESPDIEVTSSNVPSYKKTEPLNGPCKIIIKGEKQQFPVAYEDGKQGESGCISDEVPSKTNPTN